MKVIIITGGSRGLGRSAALECAARGIGVILTYNSYPEGADAVVAEIEARGGKAAALKLDVGQVASFPMYRDAVVEPLRTVWGHSDFDGLVNNAGYGLFEPIASVIEDQFDGLFNVHLRGPFFLTQILLPMMAHGADIVNLTSATTRVATAGVAPYAAFRGGLEVLTRYMAKEFGERGMRANSVSPGAIRTELGGGLSDEFEAMLAGQTALGRVGEPEDVGRVVAALLSQDHAVARVADARKIRIALHVTGSMSRGSAISATENLTTETLARIDGALVASDPSGTRPFDFGMGEVESFPLTLPDLITIWRATGVPNIETYVHASGDAFPQGDLQALPAGPTAGQRDASRYQAAVGVTDADGTVGRSVLDTVNGYTFTALAAAEAARRVLGGEVRPGFQTPAGLFGAGFAETIADTTITDIHDDPRHPG